MDSGSIIKNRLLFVALGVIIIAIVALFYGLFGIWLTVNYYEPQLQAAQAQIQALENDKAHLNKSIRSEGARHLQTVNGYQVAINRYKASVDRLEAAGLEWEFYTGVYAGCVRIFVIGNPGFSADQVIAICNAFTKEHYGLDMYHWDEPPGIDKRYIKGLAKGETS